MWKVDIYLETDSTFQGKRKRKCGYVLATTIHGEEKNEGILRDLERDIPPGYTADSHRSSFPYDRPGSDLHPHTG